MEGQNRRCIHGICTKLYIQSEVQLRRTEGTHKVQKKLRAFSYENAKRPIQKTSPHRVKRTPICPTHTTAINLLIMHMQRGPLS